MENGSGFLAIGHVTRDGYDDKFRPGGAVYYGSVTAKRLGESVRVLTSYSTDFHLPVETEGMEWINKLSLETTTFHNIYSNLRNEDSRTQILSSFARPITQFDVPLDWRNPKIVYLAPVIGEFGPDVASLFLNSKVVASIQGWTRQQDSDGKIIIKDWPGIDILSFVDVAVCSHEDIYSEDNLKSWIDCVPILIVTLGRRGSVIYENGQSFHVEAVPNSQVDPTGAGDVYATSFMIKYIETNDTRRSAKFASLVAGMSVCSHGVTSLPYLETLTDLY